MAYLPTAVIASVSPIAAGTALPTSVVLDGTGSLSGSTTSPAGDPSEVAAYQWYLLDVPNGSTTAYLLNDTTDTCTLDAIDAVGSYRVGLVVTDTAGKQSIAGFAPIQANASGVVQTVAVTTPYAFVQAPASATVTVSVEMTNTALIKPAQGDRGWFPTSYWPLMDEVDKIRGDIAGLVAITELAGGATSTISNVVVPTQFTHTSSLFAYSNNDVITVRVEFNVYITPSAQAAELALCLCDVADIATYGVVISSVVVDASCTVIGEFTLRAASGDTTFNAAWYKKGATVPATLIPDCGLTAGYSPGSPTTRIGWLLTPAASGSWTAGSSATFKKATILHRTTQYI